MPPNVQTWCFHTRCKIYFTNSRTWHPKEENNTNLVLKCRILNTLRI